MYVRGEIERGRERERLLQRFACAINDKTILHVSVLFVYTKYGISVQ